MTGLLKGRTAVNPSPLILHSGRVYLVTELFGTRVVPCMLEIQYEVSSKQKWLEIFSTEVNA